MWTLSVSDVGFLWARINSQWLVSEGATPDGALITTPVANPLDRPEANSLRVVSGQTNNPDNPYFGAADTLFLRLTDPSFRNAEGSFTFGPQPGAPAMDFTPVNYSVRGVNLIDSEPRKISNLIANQDNFAMSVIGYETQAEQKVALLDNPAGRDAPLTGAINPLPYSGWTTLFGQFFDHGLDFLKKGADGIVMVPLEPGDPLYVEGSRTNFMVASRSNTARVELGEGSTDALVLNLFGVDIQGVANASWEPVSTVALSGAYTGTLVLNGKLVTLENADAAGVVEAINNVTKITGVVATLNDNGTATLAPISNESFNTVSPFIDLSQSYGSSDSHLTFVKEYQDDGFATGRLVSGGADKDGDGRPDGMATWADIKENALKIGLTLRDYNVTDIPEVERLPVSRSNPDGTQFAFVALDNVTGERVLISDTSLEYLALNGLTLVTTGHAFLDDLARGVLSQLTETGDVAPAAMITHLKPEYAVDGSVTYVPTPVATSVLLDGHFVAGDGRANENIGLTAIHDVFHSEHNRLVGLLVEKLGWPSDDQGVLALTHVWTDPDTGLPREWSRDDLFQGAKLVAEMQYQHLVFDEFARKISPNVAAFTAYDINIDASITAEFAHAVYRFGHSMLREEVALKQVDANGVPTGVDKTIGLLEAFLNPLIYGEGTAAELAYGMSSQVGSGIDVWVTDTLRNNLDGIPLDLATLNITRGRDTGMGSLNEVRTGLQQVITDRIALLDPTGDIRLALVNPADPNLALDPITGEPLALELPNAAQVQLLQQMALELQPYASWSAFQANLLHPETLENFILAYTDRAVLEAYETVERPLTQPELDAAGASPALRAAAGYDTMSDAGKAAFDAAVELRALARRAIEDPAFMDATDPSHPAVQALNAIELWVGGLAEAPPLAGGMLGTTFDFVFATQMMDLQNGDRFYYLDRVGNTDFFAELIEGQTFGEIVMRNTGVSHLYPDIFSVPDAYVEMTQQTGSYRSINALNNASTPSPVIVIDPVTGDVSEQTVGLGQAGWVDSSVSFSFRGRIVSYGEKAFYGNAGNYVDGRGVLNPNGIGNASEVIGGTEGKDVIYALGGNDAVYGEGGDDTIYGGNGNDFLFGGAGNDRLIDNGENLDPLTGLMVGSDDIIDGGAGDDFIDAGTGFDVIRGGAGNDVIHGGIDGDDINGGDGDDIIYGGDGGGFAPDVIAGPNGVIPFALEDIIAGGAGNDILYGGEGWDRLDGGDGDDILIGGLGGEALLGARERHDGGNGSDIYIFRNIEEYDFLAEEVVDSGIGANDVDEIRFDSGNDGDTLTINGNTYGIERVVIGEGMQKEAYIGDTRNLNVDATLMTEDLELVGNDGDNVLTGANSNAALIDPVTLLPIVDGLGNPVAGPNPANWIKGNAGNDTIIGGDVNDLLEGGVGNDELAGGGGDDLIDGGEGDDFAVYSGNRSDYSVTYDEVNAWFVITDERDGSPDGTDLVQNVENFRFADGDLTADELVDFSSPLTGVGTLPVVSIAATSPASVVEGDAGVTTHRFTVTLSSPAVTPVAVAWTLAGSSVNWADLPGGVVPSGVASFGFGETTSVIEVNVSGDLVFEADETLQVTLSGPVGATLGTNTASVIILNDDAPPVVTPPVVLPTANLTGPAQTPATEGNSGTTSHIFTVTLSEAAVADATFVWTVSGADVNAADFVGGAMSGSVTVVRGQTSATFNVQVAGDLVVESNEAFQVTLSNPIGAVLGTASASSTIINDDVTANLTGPAQTPTAEGNSGTTNHIFTVTLSEAAVADATFVWTVSGADVNAADFVGGAMSGSVTVVRGQTSATFNVQVAGDLIVESNEAFQVTLSNPVGAVLGIASASSTIINDDLLVPVPAVLPATTGLIEGTSGRRGVSPDDTLTGTNNSETINGLGGNDTISGGGGNDVISGGLGNDTLSGGVGEDYFLFDVAPIAGNVDTILDFSVVDDTIVFDASVFTALSPGWLSADAFAFSTDTLNADHRVVYNATTGALFYDADGSGAGAAQQVATISTGLQLTQNDFMIVS
jgi:Ca2+-binding RTX toxin-like protein